ncbi:antirestriction protein ArdA [Agathobaculum sp.]|uniref:antirestriction protein ArdA n=1 Tax=Agathobaculum sp. TaxID=2048138 RepID=UPI002A80461D|nr:antirestriction protein ArdA [Agathobaculum sp.]MDY3617994.1 antirestriction protein ArdA [Agathobaculum sp.]
MPDYSYDKDYPFAAFITNLGKYNEGELVGEWVKFPTTYDELQKVFERIGIGKTDDFGQPYEEWFITDYDCYVGSLYDKLGEYESLDELNYLASKIGEMDRGEYNQFLAAMEIGEHSGSLREIINLTDNLDCYDIDPDIEDHDDLGRYYINELDAMQVPEHLKNYIDYEAYGRDVALEEGGSFTEFGYVRDTGSSFHEYYNGDRDNIPEEYRVMSKPEAEDELTQDEKLDMATDLAFDLDEFFRAHDKDYAGAYPDPHEAKERLADLLVADRLQEIDARLSDLGQTEQDTLPIEVAGYKEATGYEEYLDIDTAAIREALQDPDKSHVDKMLAFAEKVEREYAAEAAAFVQTPESILEQARAVYGDQTPEDTFSIYQIKDGAELRDYRFESLDSLQRAGLSVRPENYERVYTAPLTGKDDLESIFTKFNIDRPDDFHGHSLSVSDVVVFHQDGKDTAHFCDSAGFTEVPQFLEPAPVPDNCLTGETIRTPRGSFHLTDMTKEQMEAAGYGFHHASDDGRYQIMANGTRAFAIRSETALTRSEPDNPLRTAEMTLEDDYGMIDGIVNNGRRDEELEKAKEAAAKTVPDKKPSIMERLEDAKRECAGRKSLDKAAPQKKPPELGDL